MQRIERYGVIALVFLLVTILAVSLWGEGQAQHALAQVKDKASGMTNLVTSRGKSANRAEESSGIVTPSKRRAADRALPLTSQDESPLRKRSGRKGGLRTQESLEDAFVTLEPARSSSPVPTPAARTATPAQWPVAVREPATQPAPATRTARTTRPSSAAHDRSNQAPAPQGTRTYVVRSGDTLGGSLREPQPR